MDEESGSFDRDQKLQKEEGMGVGSGTWGRMKSSF